MPIFRKIACHPFRLNLFMRILASARDDLTFLVIQKIFLVFENLFVAIIIDFLEQLRNYDNFEEETGVTQKVFSTGAIDRWFSAIPKHLLGKDCRLMMLNTVYLRKRPQKMETKIDEKVLTRSSSSNILVRQSYSEELVSIPVTIPGLSLSQCRHIVLSEDLRDSLQDVRLRKNGLSGSTGVIFIVCDSVFVMRYNSVNSL
ncbi:hypothetical protein MAR_007102 [Mya arenaria]|uniref:Uncharacterized protein n=1 Tax=Mya arenaria TaxID=6604 RepID=A0ABY7DC65_MYAAR|nr:hypothetical protein MAR_007102 [Mya arenaria]